MTDVLMGAHFAANPLDPLYFVYLVLTGIKAFVRVNHARSAHDGAELTVSFDDCFSLFCVVDIAVLNGFVMECAPRPLCPAFEYSRFILESLEIHIREVDLCTLAKR
jgi:hypothetical protein